MTIKPSPDVCMQFRKKILWNLAFYKLEELSNTIYLYMIKKDFWNQKRKKNEFKGS